MAEAPKQEEMFDKDEKIADGPRVPKHFSKLERQFEILKKGKTELEKKKAKQSVLDEIRKNDPDNNPNWQNFKSIINSKDKK